MKGPGTIGSYNFKALLAPGLKSALDLVASQLTAKAAQIDIKLGPVEADRKKRRRIQRQKNRRELAKKKHVAIMEELKVADVALGSFDVSGKEPLKELGKIEHRAMDKMEEYKLFLDQEEKRFNKVEIELSSTDSKSTRDDLEILEYSKEWKRGVSMLNPGE